MEELHLHFDWNYSRWCCLHLPNGRRLGNRTLSLHSLEFHRIILGLDVADALGFYVYVRACQEKENQGIINVMERDADDDDDKLISFHMPE